MTDELGLRRAQGLLGHARVIKDDLAIAYYQLKIAKIKYDQAKRHLDTKIIWYVQNRSDVPITDISIRSHQSRGAIYRLLHKQNLMITPNTLGDDNNAQPADHSPTDSAAASRSSATQGSGRSLASGE